MNNIDKDTLAVHTFLNEIQECIADIVNGVNSAVIKQYGSPVYGINSNLDDRKVHGGNIFTSSNVVDKFSSLMETVEETDPDLYYGRMHMNITVLLDLCNQLADITTDNLSRFEVIQENLFTFTPTEINIDMIQAGKISGKIFPISLGVIKANSNLLPSTIAISLYADDDFNIHLED
nr:MAG TPA: hypothetical protein [Caudoviricetes sp.]